MRQGCVGEKDERKSRDMPMQRSYQYWEEDSGRSNTNFSNSAKSRVSNVSSHPTSTRILMPPSSSRIDDDALDDDDCAPSSGVKVNMLLAGRQRLSICDCAWPSVFARRTRPIESKAGYGLKKGDIALSSTLPSSQAAFWRIQGIKERPVEFGGNQLSRSCLCRAMFARFVLTWSPDLTVDNQSQRFSELHEICARP